MAIEIISDLGAMAFGLVTAAIVVAMYIFGVTSIGEFQFAAWAYLGIITWVVLALLSGSNTRYRDLYYATFVASVIAAIAITVTLGIVLVRILNVDPHVDFNRALAIAGALQLLLSIFAFSCFDVLYIQAYKHRELRARFFGRPTAAPAASPVVLTPTVAPASAEPAAPSGEVQAKAALLVGVYLMTPDGRIPWPMQE